MKIRASAPGKIILSGEHAVVYGFPALVTAINRRARVSLEKNNNETVIYPSFARPFILTSLERIEKIFRTKFRGFNFYIDSNIPVGCGMGSSAAIAVSLSTVLLHYKLLRDFPMSSTWGSSLRIPAQRDKLESANEIRGFKKFSPDFERINGLAYEVEKINHGNPSGVDNSISTYGGYLWFRKEAEGLKVFSNIIPKKRLPKLFIIDTGKPRETTREMVFLVSEKYKRNPKKVEKIFLKIENMTRTLLKYILNEKNLVLPELIRENERLLEELGVVSDSTINLIKEIEKLGGAAKISGAGGRKTNSGVIITYHTNENILRDFSRKKNLKIFPVRMGMKGVKIEKTQI